MPSAFAALENRLSDACDGVFGEAFEFRPMVAGVGGGRPAADGARSIKQITGIFGDHTFASRALGDVERTASRMTLRHVWLSVDGRQFAAGQAPIRRDRMMRVDTGVVYEIADINQDSEGRYKFRLADGFADA